MVCPLRRPGEKKAPRALHFRFESAGGLQGHATYYAKSLVSLIMRLKLLAFIPDTFSDLLILRPLVLLFFRTLAKKKNFEYSTNVTTYIPENNKGARHSHYIKPDLSLIHI